MSKKRLFTFLAVVMALSFSFCMTTAFADDELYPDYPFIFHDQQTANSGAVGNVYWIARLFGSAEYCWMEMEAQENSLLKTEINVYKANNFVDISEIENIESSTFRPTQYVIAEWVSTDDFALEVDGTAYFAGNSVTIMDLDCLFEVVID